uniref:Uncharacterized protein n=1 Tax=Anguilla anguilla TaxID=7936 RepID=A0A0E9RG01_ANGAN
MLIPRHTRYILHYCNSWVACSNDTTLYDD